MKPFVSLKRRKLSWLRVAQYPPIDGDYRVQKTEGPGLNQVPKHSHKAQVRVRIKMLKFARAVRVHPASRMALGRAQLQRGQRPLIVFPCCERVLPWPPGTPVCIFQDPEDGTWPDDMRPPIQARSGVPRQSLSQQFMCRLPRPRQRTAATRCGGTPRLAATWRRLSCVRR